MLEPMSLYENHLRFLSFSENTITSYKSDIRHFFNWMEKIGRTDLKGIGAADIEEYLAHLKGQKLSSATISRRVTSLRRFFVWALHNDLAYIDPTLGIQPPKVIKKSPRIPTNSDIKDLLRQCDRKTPMGIRNRAMLLIISLTGLHVSELLELKLGDFDPNKNCLMILSRQNPKVRLNKRVCLALRGYVFQARPLLISQKRVSEHLFLNTRGQPLSRQGFWKILKNMARDAGIDCEITPETLRHSFAVNALMRGQSSKEVQMKLGARTSSSVSEYMSLASKMKNQENIN